MLSFLILITSIFITCFFIGLYQLFRNRQPNSIAFFHLYCSSGGGGERVLWHMIKAIVEKYPKYTIYIYAHKSVEQDALNILLKVSQMFKIDLINDPSHLDRIQFVILRSSSLIETGRFPVLSLYLQNFFSILVALEAACRLTPEFFFETIGFTWTLPVFKLLKCKVFTYVHYPTISRDMIENVRTANHASFNNREIFIRSPLLRWIKLRYYQILTLYYGIAGRMADVIMVNSSWTRNHIEHLWKREAQVVYPPCDVDKFQAAPSKVESGDLATPSKNLNIISVAQFRPEKNHQMQIEAFDLFVNKARAYGSTLTLYGSCRDETDLARVDDLKETLYRLDLSSMVHFEIGVPFERLAQALKEADVAIHTMENEHFGIVLVECMAAGLITVAHNSGGPKTDIIDDKKNGFLASNVQEFADKLITISEMSQDRRNNICKSAIEKSNRFSVKVFETRFIELVDRYLAG